MIECHRMDTEKEVFFYENQFYVLSNFSAFNLVWKMRTFPTAEHAYHWSKFPNLHTIQNTILFAPSAHEALQRARYYKSFQRPDWKEVKISIMKEILLEKARQHSYVYNMLMKTGDRILVEDSWRDDFWGWGPNKDGKNVMGKLWMDVRTQLREDNSNAEKV
jgi:ribA/ribD-fused uncharacterized protein